MSAIRSGWEKKCLDQTNEYKDIITELEKRKNLELSNLQKDHQIESDNLLREYNKYKQDSELLKNFDKEFIRVTKHKDILEEECKEIRRKNQIEVRQIREEVDNELKKRILRLDDDKKLEYEFLTENLRKTLK